MSLTSHRDSIRLAIRHHKWRIALTVLACPSDLNVWFYERGKQTTPNPEFKSVGATVMRP